MASDNISGIKFGATTLPDAEDAVADLFAKIVQPDIHSVLFFCSSRYDLDKLGSALKGKFHCLLVGCTTAGEISSAGYQEGGIVGISFSAHNLRLHCHIIHPLNGFTLTDAQNIVASTRDGLSFSERIDKDKMFGFLLIDGLSNLEEQVASYLHSQFEGVSIVGGSAGDDLQLEETKIYSDGEFLSNAASITLFETTLPFSVFKTQHFQPTDKKMVITEADPPRRIVSEINAEPAALEYARILGRPVAELSPAIFSKYPLMIRIADNWQVRSIQKMNEDYSLTFYCAIDTGLVLTLSEGVDIVSNLESELNEVSRRLPAPQLIIVCDCISRRLEIMEKGLEGKIAELLKDKNFIGFNTYGEQFNSVHVNQTLTGVIIGGENGAH